MYAVVTTRWIGANAKTGLMRQRDTQRVPVIAARGSTGLVWSPPRGRRRDARACESGGMENNKNMRSDQNQAFAQPQRGEKKINYSSLCNSERFCFLANRRVERAKNKEKDVGRLPCGVHAFACISSAKEAEGLLCACHGSGYYSASDCGVWCCVAWRGAV